MNRRRKIGIALGIIVIITTGCIWHMVSSQQKEVKVFTATLAFPGSEMEADNYMEDKIAELTGARAEVTWLDGQNPSDLVKSMIVSGEYPDFIQGSDATKELLDAGAFIPLEDYLDDYPNLKNYMTDEQWESYRKEDGYIYFIPSYGVIRGHDTKVMKSGEAFWIQKRVLEWAGYPKLQTLDDYFDLICDYRKEHPKTDGEDTIGFEILCDDWRYFCLENPPMFLAGYPNDGCAVIDRKTQTAKVYDTIPEAKQYYKKLSSIYEQGVIDPETFMLSYDQYIEKIKQGNVLGMVDQYWEIQSAQNSLYANGKEEYTYVPFPITASEDIKPDYNCIEYNLQTGEGIGISTSCQDVEGALQFLNDLLSDEVMKLRYWGEEGRDYEVGENGVFYRTKEQRDNWDNDDYLKQNSCTYEYFPTYEGMLPDGINTVLPREQPGEYYASLSAYDKKVLDAYGYQIWSDFLGEEREGDPWYPIYPSAEDWGMDTEYGKAKEDMKLLKKEWLPKLIMTSPDEFDAAWDHYVDMYNSTINVKAYEKQLDIEIQNRMKNRIK